MQDPRIDRLASLLLDHSTRIAAGEKILIEAYDLPDEQLVCRLVEGACERGAIPVVNVKRNQVLRSLYRGGSADVFELIGEIEADAMRRMDAYIGIRGTTNTEEMSDVPEAQLKLVQQKIWQPVHLQLRVPKTRWVVLRYPTASMAQSANMSTAAFEDFYFNVCTADYVAMAENQEPLKQRMLEAKDVRILAPGTDLSFSIEGIPVVPCNGRRNIPDGEVFTAPVLDSVNGVIQYNTSSRYQGTVFRNIRFELEKGKIVNASCENATERLNSILDTDEGARYIGEWSLGCNNRITTPMLDTLFDEKIGGSLHFTPGNAYETADNGNRSAIHWDLVLIQTPAYGGGEIWFDGELVRKDGRFLPRELRPLNEGLAA